MTGGKASFDGKGWTSIRDLGSDSRPSAISDHTKLMDKAGGWNKDMAWAELFFGPWSSPNEGNAWAASYD
jgi:hypothetical protein